MSSDVQWLQYGNGAGFHFSFRASIHGFSNSAVVGRGVFGASYNCTKSEVSTRGISVASLDLLVNFVFGAYWVAAVAKDLANQIRHWDVYVKEIANCNAVPGSFLNPLAAEWFSGLGLND